MAATDDPLGDVLQALVATWTANAATFSAINGPYLFEKPAKPSVGFPYVVIEPEASQSDRWTCSKELWFSTVTFWSYDTTPEKVRGHMNTIRSVYAPEGLSLSLPNGTVVRKRLIRSAIEQLDEHVHRGSVPLSIYISRARTG